MKHDYPFTNDELFAFIDKAGKATWANDMPAIPKPERNFFDELTFSEGAFEYRDSFVGYNPAFGWGTEIVRYNGQPVWNCHYGGGMFEGYEYLAQETYDFLKKALKNDAENFQSFRGPEMFEQDEWKYAYQQDGDITNFYGYEEITQKNTPVFFHRVFGGMVK